jgi:hypothetical protein
MVTDIGKDRAARERPSTDEESGAPSDSQRSARGPERGGPRPAFLAPDVPELVELVGTAEHLLLDLADTGLAGPPHVVDDELFEPGSWWAWLGLAAMAAAGRRPRLSRTRPTHQSIERPGGRPVTGQRGHVTPDATAGAFRTPVTGVVVGIDGSASARAAVMWGAAAASRRNLDLHLVEVLPGPADPGSRAGPRVAGRRRDPRRGPGPCCPGRARAPRRRSRSSWSAPTRAPGGSAPRSSTMPRKRASSCWAPTVPAAPSRSRSDPSSARSPAGAPVRWCWCPLPRGAGRRRGRRPCSWRWRRDRTASAPSPSPQTWPRGAGRL